LSTRGDTPAVDPRSVRGRSESRPVDLLVITHDRSAYLERTLRTLLADPADFRLYFWDNASSDGAADLVAAIDDPRVVEKHFSTENVMQEIPTRWFLEAAGSDVIGKVDDDTLVPEGWTERIAPALREEDRLGMIGCWTFMPEDFTRNEAVALGKVITVGRHQVLRDIAIGGTGFLVRRETAARYLSGRSHGRAFPIDRIRMTRDGLISGWYYPLLFAEHMDDPRSEFCLMKTPEDMGETAALTARARGIDTPERYLGWIIADVDRKMSRSIRRQVWDARLDRAPWTRLLRLMRRRSLGRTRPAG
jgi:Glycosyl transferase family 2